MAILSDLLVGKSEQTQGSGSQWQKSTRTPNERMQQPADLLTRQIIGQAVNPPNTAISVPTQQAISNLQATMGQGSGSLAQRLGPQAAASAASPQSGAGGSYLPGANQQGLQTREQLGLPDRKDYFTFVPSAEDIAGIGLADVRGGNKAITTGNKKINKLEDRIATRQAAGKMTGQAENRLAKLQQKQERRRGATYA